MSNQDSTDPAGQMRRLSRRSFLTGAVAAAAGLAGWQWLRTRPEADGVPWPLRRVLGFNGRIWSAAFRENSLAQSFPVEEAQEPRLNGGIGLQGAVDPRAWRLHVQSTNGRELRLGLDDVRRLPRVEHVTELKCIEGWSTVVHWAGARLRDLAAHYRLEAPYVGLQTPDAEYFVGLDAASAMHSQTLLCYEMNGAPLTPGHGAPLRLVIPVKYGIKNLKRIGVIRFTEDRPEDYWAQRGYDWYAGL
jgi:DMSO/TMAO reductase YedYZ molybdopterin-dependent catalytic subunit